MAEGSSDGNPKWWPIRLGDTLQILSGIIAAIVGAALVYAVSNLSGRIDPAVAGFKRQLELLKTRQAALVEGVDRFHAIVERAEKIELKEFSGAIILERQHQLEQRISAVEATLNLQPRQIINLVRLTDEVEDLRGDLEAAQIAVIREADRAYNTVLALIGGLIVAVFVMVIGNILRSRGRA